MHELEMVAKQLVGPGKGVLAADESFPTIAKRFGSRLIKGSCLSLVRQRKRVLKVWMDFAFGYSTIMPSVRVSRSGAPLFESATTSPH